MGQAADLQENHATPGGSSCIVDRDLPIHGEVRQRRAKPQSLRSAGPAKEKESGGEEIARAKVASLIGPRPRKSSYRGDTNPTTCDSRAVRKCTAKRAIHLPPGY